MDTLEDANEVHFEIRYLRNSGSESYEVWMPGNEILADGSTGPTTNSKVHTGDMRSCLDFIRSITIDLEDLFE